MEIYPIKFNPILKERLWGGQKLGTVLNKKVTADGIGESWELSGVQGDVSIASNGPYHGKSLSELAEVFGEDLLGRKVVRRFGTEFPILIKFIDASQDLSVQLHPGDDLARKRHDSFGKTEMWYIMEAEPGAELIIGFNRDTSQEEYEQALNSGRLLELLHYEPVQEGDAFFINSGKIHAIGAGVMLAEIQQSSDVTYRVYDFDRRDAQGNPRQLHTELALEAMDYMQRDDFRIDYENRRNSINAMVDSTYFKTAFLELDTLMKLDLEDRDSFTVYICVGGNAAFVLGDHTVSVSRGETVMIPAVGGELSIMTEQCRLLQVSL